MGSHMVSREFLILSCRSRPLTCNRVVYSTEVPGDVKLLPLPEEEFKKGSVKELQAFDDFRVRILPVIGT